ncbi:MAG: Gfo/Idh/MocA family oxidoreductase, partial [Verrucomicrobiota bacterium]
MNRRQSLKTIVGFGALAPLGVGVATKAVSPGSRLNIAAVGAGGKGYDDLMGTSDRGHRHDVVAICDIDHRNGGEQPPNLSKGQALRPLGLGKARSRFPKAKVYDDYRKMLEQKDIDAVTVSTPDHMHATMAITAMELGKHVFVQKPLTQTIHESRIMRKVANENGVVTQMGNQGHSSSTYRSAVAALRSGVVGRVREVHAWTSSPSWPQGIPRLDREDPVPKGVDWDLWVGVGEPRPFLEHVYHNFNWRGWREFGTGALGDMGCHIIDPAVWSLELGPPREVSAVVKGPAAETYPTSSTVTYRFEGTSHTADELTLYWYDGGNHPPGKLGQMMAKIRNGTIYVGEEG